jgi:G3E family GTPase
MVLKKYGLDFVEINNGSVFCSCLKGAFIDALIGYSELPIDYLFVESSGMADPSNIKQILNDVVGKVKGQEYDYGGAICLVDSLNFLEQVEVLAPIERQIAASDLIIINKVDLVEQVVLKGIKKKILALNPEAKCMEAKHCQIDLSFLSHGLSPREKAQMGTCCNTPKSRPAAHIITTQGVFDEQKFMDFIKALAPRALRMKGFFQLTGGWRQIDVAGNQLAIKAADITPAVSQLVIISDQGLPFLQQIYQNWDERFSEQMEVG